MKNVCFHPKKHKKPLKFRDFCVRVQNCCTIMAPPVGLAFLRKSHAVASVRLTVAVPGECPRRKRLRPSPTAATRSGRSSRPRRRSRRSLPPSLRSVGITTIRQSQLSDANASENGNKKSPSDWMVIFYWLPLLDLNQRPAD